MAGDVPHHLPEVLDSVGQWGLCSYEPHTVGIGLLCNKTVDVLVHAFVTLQKYNYICHRPLCNLD